MPKQMENKTCLITGGAGSIGVAAARLLAAEGAKVMLVDLVEAALSKIAADIGQASADKNIAWRVADVTRSDEVKNCVAATVKRWGKIDVLFSNEEVARSVLYLASDASSFTTGSRLMVDGGLSA